MSVIAFLYFGMVKYINIIQILAKHLPQLLIFFQYQRELMAEFASVFKSKF